MRINSVSLDSDPARQLIIANKIYSAQEFDTLTAKSIFPIKSNYQRVLDNRIFKAGTSFLFKNKSLVVSCLKFFLEKQIVAFVVADREQRMLTIWHEIPCLFNKREKQGIVKFNRQKISTIK